MTLAPFEIRKSKALQANAHLPILHENVSYDEWKRMSAARLVPTGSKWVAATAIVYGPEPKHEPQS